MNVLTVNNVELQIKEWNGERVVTLAEIDKLHERKKGTAKQRFTNHRKHMIEGTDYYMTTYREFNNEFGRSERPKGNPNLPMALITKSGYLMLVKVMEDPKSWEVQRQLVNAYFMLEKLAEQKKEEPKNEVIVSQPTDLSMEFKKFMEFETKKNEEFRDTMIKGFATMASLIVNQNKLIERLLGEKTELQPASVKEDRYIPEPPAMKIPHYEDEEKREWKRSINNLLIGKDRNQLLSETYKYMNKKYGICWDQLSKEYISMYGKPARNNLELAYFMEDRSENCKNLTRCCLETIIEKNEKNNVPATLNFPVKNTKEIKRFVDFIAEKTEKKSPYNSAIYRGFFEYVDKHGNIKWQKFENKYRNANGTRPSHKVTKLEMMEFSPTVAKTCIKLFNDYVKERYKNLVEVV